MLLLLLLLWGVGARWPLSDSSFCLMCAHSSGLRQKLQDAEAAKLALQNEISNACLENREACKKICDTVAEL